MWCHSGLNTRPSAFLNGLMSNCPCVSTAWQSTVTLCSVARTICRCECVCVCVWFFKDCTFPIMPVYKDKNVIVMSSIGFLVPVLELWVWFYNQLSCVSRLLDTRSIWFVPTRVGCTRNGQFTIPLVSWLHCQFSICKILPNQTEMDINFVIHFWLTEPSACHSTHFVIIAKLSQYFMLFFGAFMQMFLASPASQTIVLRFVAFSCWPHW